MSSPAKSPRPLTPKQQRFVEEYLIEPNATQAAIKAGYSEHTAKEMGAENLTKPHIAAALAAHRAIRAKQVGIDANWALERLKIEAELQGKGSSHAARVTAIGLAMKHLGILVDQIEIKQPVSLRVVEEIVDGHAPENHPPAPGPV